MFAVVSLAIGVTRYWKDMIKVTGAKPKVSIASAITETIGEILAHKRFEQCNVAKDRKMAHMLVFFSFIGLAITTAWAVLYLYGYEIMEAMGKTPYPWLLGPSPYPLTDPVKWLGNASAIMLLIGIVMVINNRKKNEEKAGKGGYYDWLFIYIVFAIMATGILSELARSSRYCDPCISYLFFSPCCCLFPFCLCTVFKDGAYGVQGNGNGFCKGYRKGCRG